MNRVHGSTHSSVLYQEDISHFPFDPPLEGEDQDAEGLLHGRLVTWKPTSYDIVRIPSYYVVATPMNIWNASWMNYLYNLILNHKGFFETPFGWIEVLSLENIAETNSAMEHGLFEYEYDLEAPWTTQNEQWDRLIMGWYSDTQYLQLLQRDLDSAFKDAVDQEDLDLLLMQIDEELTESIGVDRDGLDTLLEEAGGLEEAGVDYEDKTILEKIQTLIDYIKKTEPGDVGEIVLHLEDGNHRAMAAIAAGEPYIFASIPKLDHYRRKQPEIWKKLEHYLVED